MTKTTTTTSETLTDAQIHALLQEARQAGDYKLVITCGDALSGDDAAREKVARAIADAEAMAG